MLDSNKITEEFLNTLRILWLSNNDIGKNPEILESCGTIERYS